MATNFFSFVFLLPVLLLVVRPTLCEIGAKEEETDLKSSARAKKAVPLSPFSDFVGFSYSRASQAPPSDRFIHFINEVSTRYSVSILLPLCGFF